MNAEEILNLFELIRKAPEENWEYNKSRLREIFLDYEKEKEEVFIMNGKCINTSTVTNKVIHTLENINNSHSLDEILYSPCVREKFRESLHSQLAKN